MGPLERYGSIEYRKGKSALQAITYVHCNTYRRSRCPRTGHRTLTRARDHRAARSSHGERGEPLSVAALIKGRVQLLDRPEEDAATLRNADLGLQPCGCARTLEHQLQEQDKNKISDTLFNGYERSPGVYYRYKVGSGCSPNRRKNFKVVVNKGPLGGRPGGLTPQGIITATVEYTIPIVASPSRHKVAC